MSRISSFRIIKNKFCKFLRKRGIKLINFRKKKMKLVTKEQQESCKNAKICYICKAKFEKKYLKDKNYHKVRDHRGDYRGAPHSICSLRYIVPKKIAVVFPNASHNLS